MSIWRQNPDGATAELVRRSGRGLDLAGRVLVANGGPAMRAAVAALGVTPDAWSRRAGDVERPAPWPDGGPYDVVFLRLAKAKDEQAMSLHAALSVLAPGGRLLVCGGNEEGIKSAAVLLEPLCGPTETLSTLAHGRIVSTRRPAAIAGLRPTLADWRRMVQLAIGGTARAWATYPGAFAAGHLDEGTSLMLTALPARKSEAHILDYGCGSGVIAGAMRARQPQLQIDLLDSDSVALLAAAENVAGARCILGTGLEAAGAVRYDAIVSNPPLHNGLAEDHRMLARLIAQAPKFLRKGGLLQIVVQRRIALDALLAEHTREAVVVAETGTFRVWRANAP